MCNYCSSRECFGIFLAPKLLVLLRFFHRLEIKLSFGKLEIMWTKYDFHRHFLSYLWWNPPDRCVFSRLILFSLNALFLNRPKWRYQRRSGHFGVKIEIYFPKKRENRVVFLLVMSRETDLTFRKLFSKIFGKPRLCNWNLGDLKNHVRKWSTFCDQNEKLQLEISCDWT